MLNLVLFGPPGAGKGTQAELLAKEYKLVHLSTGELLRTEIKQKTALGIEAKKLIDKGFLVPDEVVVGIINNQIRQNKEANGFIFDGFPRTIPQAKQLDELLKKYDESISTMLCLEVPKEELKRRLLKRGADSGRSDDANEEIIENRINVYNNQTKPLIDYYKAQNKFNIIEGNGTIEQTCQKLIAAVNTIK